MASYTDDSEEKNQNFNAPQTRLVAGIRQFKKQQTTQPH